MSGSRNAISDNQASASENESDRHSSSKQYVSHKHSNSLQANNISDESILLSNQKYVFDLNFLNLMYYFPCTLSFAIIVHDIII